MVDPELDDEGLQLEKEIYCGRCNFRMDKVSPHAFRCPKCREVYEEK